jgi:DNA-binding PucR family transcriptional regulator
VRDELLKVFGPAPLWLVHGATYDSFEGLEEALTQTVRAAERVRQEQDERYVLEVNGWGLDSLLENPKLSGGLATFAESTLAPLAAYDRETGSQLTETLCRVLTSGSLEEAAEHLFVHPNTVRYRVRRAEQLLGRELGAPKEKAALTLAAFVWYRGGRTP